MPRVGSPLTLPRVDPKRENKAASALAELASLRAPRRGIYASGGPQYRAAVFGRDSLEVAEDLAPHDRPLAREIVTTLAALQGETVDDITEEEPGRIPHEYRRSAWDGEPVSDESLEILSALSASWGGTPDALLYYGSVDATPLFARVVAQLCRLHGPALLQEVVRRRSGEETTLENALTDACGWVCRRLEASDLGLLEFRSSNPNGLPVQTWKDSPTGIVHPDGVPANTDGPVATLDLQALAFDALQAAAELLPAHRDVGRWIAHCRRLAQIVPELFWIDGGAHFAQAVDRDEEGSPRVVATRASEAGVLLASGLFDAFERDVRDGTTAAVVTTLLGPEFLTDVGIRCRSLLHEPTVPFADYHGAWASWPKETCDAASGLARQGFPVLARVLEDRVLSAVAIAREHYELFYVSPQGGVLYRPHASSRDLPRVVATHLPERAQAWTVSGALSIKRRRARARRLTPTRFESAVISGLPAVDPRSFRRVDAEPTFALDLEAVRDRWRGPVLPRA